jgi:hypothetical protein
MYLLGVFVVSFFLSILACHLIKGLARVHVYKEEINEAFNRDPRPFSADQRWLLKTMLVLFNHTMDWEEEVGYYKNGLPEWRRPGPSPQVTWTQISEAEIRRVWEEHQRQLERLSRGHIFSERDQDRDS